ncbi:hypothetical protein BGW39_003972 [Mortierella sp. 14UC]|nr:hypothetical protein BGW39_003972 [Mortierella sp. 14UC]
MPEQPATNVVKKEAKTPKAKKDGEPPKVGKKRGQYKKTILRKQAEAEAAAAAAAAAAGVPYITPRPLSPIASTKLQPTNPHTTSLQQLGTVDKSTTVESLAVKSQKSRHETPADSAALEMERELAMLAEEAEEDRRRREEEAADRILKRAQVVKHLRSLKSKLATAQIQIGHDLHNESVDLFSQLYDEVLEDIGKDNSEMMELLKSAREQDGEPQLDQEGSTHTHPGHMLTRSSDRPKKQDLISALSSPAPFPSRSQFSDTHGSTSRRQDFEGGFDNDGVKFKRYRRGRSDGHFIGQSWDVSGQEGGTVGAKDMTPAKSKSSYQNTNGSVRPKVYKVEDDTDNDDDGSNGEVDMPTPKRPCALGPRTREELQLRQRRELEGLQSQQRKDQEEFQRRQLDQLRELQERHNEEFHKFEAAKAKVYQEHLDGLAEKRLKISQSQYHRAHHSTPTRPKQKSAYGSSSLAYEFESGFDTHNSDHSSSPSRSPSPPPRHSSQQPRQSHSDLGAFSSAMEQPHAIRNTLSPMPVTSTPRAPKTASSVHQLPMSTMTMALTAMNEKKKLLKRAANKKQNEQGGKTAELSECGEYFHSRLQSPPIWSQKRETDEERVQVKRRASTVSTTSELLSSATATITSRHIQHSTEQHIRTGHHQGAHRSIDQSSPFADPSDIPHTPPPKTRGRKRKNPQATMVVVSPDQDDSSHETPSKAHMDFSKELLSHFDNWKPDENTEHFFDLVLSDPPETHVDEADVEGLLSGGRRPSESAPGGQDANATPTSNAFRWYQEQQRLADELAQQPRMTPLRLNGDASKGATLPAVSTTTSVAGDQTHGGSPFVQGLVPGEDPLAAFIEPTKKLRHTQGNSSSSHGHNKHVRATSSANESHVGSGSSNQGQGSLIADSSPFLESSPMAMLFSEDGSDEWNFDTFTTNADFL